MLRRTFSFSLLLLIINVACSLLEGPPPVVIPTPIPTAPPFNIAAASAGELVVNPISDVTPAVDPDIQALLGQVSRQQLIGYVQTLEGFRTRSTYSVVDDPQIGIGAARLWIFNEFLRVGNGRLLVQSDNFPINRGGVIYNQQNIVATLPGSGPHPGVVIISAHYDSRTVDPFDGQSFAPGANDNASGVAAMLELARLLSSRTWNQTIVFVAFAAEEQGRLGSIHFVSDRMLSGWQIDAVINNDIVGGRPGIPQSIRIFSPGADTAPTRQLTRYIDYVSTLYLPQFPTTMVNSEDREGRFSDHISFLQAGVPAVRLTESQEDPNRQHNAQDTWEWIDFDYLTWVTQLNLAVAANAIGAPTPAPTPQVAPMNEPGGYILTWPPDLNAGAYAISFRPVEEDAYPPFRFVSGRQAGNVAITGLDPGVTYAVSIAALSESGRIGLFSPEVLAGP